MADPHGLPARLRPAAPVAGFRSWGVAHAGVGWDEQMAAGQPGPPDRPLPADGCPQALQLACHYVPAQTTAEVGGDWFDVIPLPESRCALTVGDVTGHDISAASLMGQLRTAPRALATLGLSPADLLTRLHQITADLTAAETSATCLYAVHDPATADCDTASAGHPPPALASPGHPPGFPDLPVGLPLGTGPADGPYRAVRLRLPP